VHGVVLDQPGERVTRRLAAILVAGYSRLLPGDEKENFAELRGLLTGVIGPQIGEFGGNIFKETAELVLADFDDVVEASRCAAALCAAVV
jgi:class 3 adenylate cyclase